MPLLHCRSWIATALAALCVAPNMLSSQSSASTAADSLTISVNDAIQRLSAKHPQQALAAATREVAEAARADARSARANRLLPAANVSFGTQRLAQNQFAAIARRAGLTPVPIEQADPFTQVFAAPNIRTASLSASLRPFDGGVADARVSASTHGVRAARLVEVQIRAMLEVAVIQHYTDVQVQQRLLAVADSALAQARRALSITRQAFTAGRAAEFEVWRAEAAAAAQRPVRIEAERLAQVAELALRQLLDTPTGVTLRLTSPLEHWSDSVATDNEPVERPFALDVRRESRVAVQERTERAREASDLWKASWRVLLPVVDVNVNHQRFAYPLRGTNWSGPYFQNTSVGVLVSLPLDLTGATASRIDAAKAAERVAQAQRREAERGHDLEAAEIILALNASRELWRAAIVGARSAEHAYRIAVTRYEVGRSSLLELQDARLAWQQAMAARALGARDRTIAEARATRFTQLPLSNSSP